MHRAFSLILAVLLIVALAIPAFAYEVPGISIPFDLDAKLAEHNKTHAVLEQTETYSKIYMNTGNIYYNKSAIRFSGQTYVYVLNSGANSWVLDYVYSSTSFPSDNLVWATHYIYDSEGNLHYPSLTECDGSSCPANDVNHDNICDDCGLVLTYNLRSSLLDFAKAQAESWAHIWPYYAVVQESLTDRYYVYMANNPMVADEETGTIVTAPNKLNWFDVRTNSDGSYKASGNYSAESWAGELLYANHDIENFRTPPLAVIIQGVTGEALETTLPNLMNQVKTIVLSGVLCLALLISLLLLRRSLRTFGVG